VANINDLLSGGGDGGDDGGGAAVADVAIHDLEGEYMMIETRQTRFQLGLDNET